MEGVGMGLEGAQQGGGGNRSGRGSGTAGRGRGSSLNINTLLCVSSLHSATRSRLVDQGYAQDCLGPVTPDL